VSAKAIASVLCGSLIFLTTFAAEPKPASSAPPYRAPRTTDGKPDLQGFWTNSSVTRLERPATIQKLVLSESEATAMVHNDALVERVRKDAQSIDPKTGLLDGRDLAAGQGYNAFWIDPGETVGRVRGELRSSWIVYPDNGRVPYSTAGREQVAQAQKRSQSFDGPEVRPLGDRCLATTGRTGPPAISGLYNNNYQIIQTPTHVVILNEMVHYARVVRIGGKHVPSNVKYLFGDSVGWWDGDTLVVETTNFNELRAWHAHPAYLSTNAKVTERFSRYSATQLFYEFTVDDPVFYTTAWRGESSFNRSNELIYEYACHEGNYAMIGILAGAREQEKKKN
jgi:hypothetical protein